MTEDLKFYAGDTVRFGGCEGVLEDTGSSAWPVRLRYDGGAERHFHLHGGGPRLELIERGKKCADQSLHNRLRST